MIAQNQIKAIVVFSKDLGWWCCGNRHKAQVRLQFASNQAIVALTQDLETGLFLSE